MAAEPLTPEDVVRSLNAAWVEGRCEDMLPLLDEHAVVSQPGFAERSTGPDEIVAGFEDFVQNANIVGYDETDFVTDLFGDTAVVTYRFDIGYEMDGEMSRDTGHDLFVLKRDAGEWRVVWRTLIPDGSDA